VEQEKGKKKEKEEAGEKEYIAYLLLPFSFVNSSSTFSWTPGVREEEGETEGVKWGQEEENSDEEQEHEEGVGERELITQRISHLRHSFLNFGGEGGEGGAQGEKYLTTSASSLLSSLGFVGFDLPSEELEHPFNVPSASSSGHSWGTLGTGSPSCLATSDDPEMRSEMRKLEELFYFGFYSKTQLEERKEECRQLILEKRRQEGKERKKKERAEKLREKLRLIREIEEKNDTVAGSSSLPLTSSPSPIISSSSKKPSTAAMGVKSPNTTGNPSLIYPSSPSATSYSLLLGKQLSSSSLRGKGRGRTTETSEIESGSRRGCGRSGRGGGGERGGDLSAIKPNEGPCVEEGSGRGRGRGRERGRERERGSGSGRGRGRGGSTGEEKHTWGRGRG
jgi:hypothetical protein